MALVGSVAVRVSSPACSVFAPAPVCNSTSLSANTSAAVQNNFLKQPALSRQIKAL